MSINDLDNKFIKNYNNLRDTQDFIKKKLTLLIGKNDKKSKRERDELKMLNTKLETNVKELTERLRRLGLDI